MTERAELQRYWSLVAVCAAGVGIGVASLPFYTQGVFIGAWIDEYGWTRTEASLGILGSTLALAFISPFVGAAVDRFGLIRPIAFALVGLTLSFCLFALFMNSVVAFVGLSIVMSLLGAASSPLAYTRAINTVFNKQRGIALGLVLSGTGIAAAIAPALVSDLIVSSGWRFVYWVLAAFTALTGIGIIIVLSRVALRAQHQPADPAIVKASFHKAARSSTFWRLLGAVLLLATGVGGLIVHFVPILIEVGQTAPMAARTAGIIGIAVILGRLVVGVAVDRFFAPYVACAIIVLCISGILMLALIGGPAAPIAAFAIGFSIGAEVDLIGYMVARYFGMAAYGRVYGAQYAAFLVGTGVSPVLIGVVADHSGGYGTALYGTAVILAVSAVFFATLPGFDTSRTEQLSVQKATTS